VYVPLVFNDINDASPDAWSVIFRDHTDPVDGHAPVFEIAQVLKIIIGKSGRRQRGNNVIGHHRLVEIDQVKIIRSRNNIVNTA